MAEYDFSIPTIGASNFNVNTADISKYLYDSAKNRASSAPSSNATKSDWWGTGGYLDIGSQALGTLGNLYLGSQSLGLGKAQLRNAKQEFGMNWGAQARLMNNDMRDRWARQYVYEGYSQAEADAMAANRLATEGVPETIADAKRVFMSPSNVPTPNSSVVPQAPAAQQVAQAPSVADQYKMNYLVG